MYALRTRWILRVHERPMGDAACTHARRHTAEIPGTPGARITRSTGITVKWCQTWEGSGGETAHSRSGPRIRPRPIRDFQRIRHPLSRPRLPASVSPPLPSGHSRRTRAKAENIMYAETVGVDSRGDWRFSFRSRRVTTKLAAAVRFYGIFVAPADASSPCPVLVNSQR